MVSEIQERVNAQANEIFVEGFGLIDSQNIEAGIKYQGRLYRLSADAIKTLSELVGFTTKFDSPSIRTCYLDLFKADGTVVFEIERNTNPTELGLRYSRDRWSSLETATKGGNALRPWIKTCYQARFLPEKILFGLTEQLKLKFDQREHFFVRINFKDRTVGLIAEEKYLEEFPAGAYQAFALPADNVVTIESTTLESEATFAKEAKPGDSSRPIRQTTQEPTHKYATYSQSEIDRMFKLQTESIANSLGAKISSQQRAFQDVIITQEKSFAKILDKLVAELEETKAKLEEYSKNSQEAKKAELAQFNASLSKELSEFRTHLNKNVLPISKTFEEKIQSIQATAKTTGKENQRPLLIGIAAAIIVTILACTGLLFSTTPKASDFAELKTELTKGFTKIEK